MKAKAKCYTSIPLTTEEFRQLRAMKNGYEQHVGTTFSWGQFLLGVGIAAGIAGLAGYYIGRSRTPASENP